MVEFARTWSLFGSDRVPCVADGHSKVAKVDRRSRIFCRYAVIGRCESGQELQESARTFPFSKRVRVSLALGRCMSETSALSNFGCDRERRCGCGA